MNMFTKLKFLILYNPKGLVMKIVIIGVIVGAIKIIIDSIL
jgi:hypothetical protein